MRTSRKLRPTRAHRRSLPRHHAVAGVPVGRPQVQPHLVPSIGSQHATATKWLSCRPAVVLYEPKSLILWPPGGNRTNDQRISRQSSPGRLKRAVRKQRLGRRQLPQDPIRYTPVQSSGKHPEAKCAFPPRKISAVPPRGPRVQFRDRGRSKTQCPSTISCPRVG
jgi:hypothetical protein